jgi:hypothetical protein
MRNADSAAVAGVFSPDCTMQTIATDKAGKAVVRTEQVSRFASSIARQKPGVIDEQITVETNYSHGGVNMFCLVNLGGQWKIQYLIDTRRK